MSQLTQPRGPVSSSFSYSQRAREAGIGDCSAGRAERLQHRAASVSASTAVAAANDLDNRRADVSKVASSFDARCDTRRRVWRRSPSLQLPVQETEPERESAGREKDGRIATVGAGGKRISGSTDRPAARTRRTRLARSRARLLVRASPRRREEDRESSENAQQIATSS